MADELRPDGLIFPGHAPVGDDMGAFYRHLEDTHLDPHPQYLRRDDATRPRLHLSSDTSVPTGAVNGDVVVVDRYSGAPVTGERSMLYLVEDGALRLPWNLPWGLRRVLRNTTMNGANAFGLVASWQTLPGLSFTLTVPGTRMYRMTAQVAHYDSSGPATAQLRILVDSTTTVAGSYSRAAVANSAQTTTTTGVYETTTPSSVTVAVQMQSLAATAFQYAFSSVLGPATLIVEDIGPGTAFVA